MGDEVTPAEPPPPTGSSVAPTAGGSTAFQFDYTWTASASQTSNVQVLGVAPLVTTADYTVGLTMTAADLSSCVVYRTEWGSTYADGSTFPEGSATQGPSGTPDVALLFGGSTFMALLNGVWTQLTSAPDVAANVHYLPGGEIPTFANVIATQCSFTDSILGTTALPMAVVSSISQSSVQAPAAFILDETGTGTSYVVPRGIDTQTGTTYVSALEGFFEQLAGAGRITRGDPAAVVGVTGINSSSSWAVPEGSSGYDRNPTFVAGDRLDLYLEVSFTKAREYAIAARTKIGDGPAYTGQSMVFTDSAGVTYTIPVTETTPSVAKSYEFQITAV